MAKGVASAELVVAMGKDGFIGSFGAGGLPLSKIEDGIKYIQSKLTKGEPYAVNLIHSPSNPNLESGCVDLLLKYGVRFVEASAFMGLTSNIVRYHASGLEMQDGKVVSRNKVIWKLSRTEVAKVALAPPPAQMLAKLVADGSITKEQADMATTIPIASSLIVESDSGGHTDRRPLTVIFPLIKQMAGDNVLVGAAGGIGCPEAMVAAFAMGADFVVTGSINQLCQESGTSDHVRRLLRKTKYSDVAMAPAADMFSMGVKLQVVKTPFVGKSLKLWDAFCKYDSIDAIPNQLRKKLESTTFKASLDEVWESTKAYYLDVLKDRSKVEKAERDPKLKMDMCFRSYLGQSSRWAQCGDKNRLADMQIWCGPCMGHATPFSMSIPSW